MSNQIIYVPKFIPVTYENANGEQVKVNLRQNRDYRIDLSTSSDPIYCTIESVETEKCPNGKSYLILSKILTPGYMCVVKDAEEGNAQIRVPVDDIVEIRHQRSTYTRVRRSFKEMKNRPATKSFIFAFDNSKYSSQYRITVYGGEFLAFAVRNKDNNTRTFFGEIEGTDDADNIYIARYISKNGVREIIHNYKISVEALLGIYRHELTIEDYVEAKPDTEDVPAKQEADENP